MTMPILRPILRPIVLAAAALAASHVAAKAGAFAIREQSAEAQGLSFAGAAAGSGGLSSMFWNPATITMRPGFHQEGNITTIVPDSRITPTAGTSPLLLPLGPSGQIGQTAVIPSSYASRQFNDRVWIGLATAAPFGLLTSPNRVWAGQTYGQTSKVFTLGFNPIVGIKVTDWLSIAGGPVAQYFKVTLRQATGFLPTSPSGFLRGDDWGVGYTVGATVTPWAGTAIGLGYRSSVHHGLEGPAFGLGRASVNLNTPDKLSVGIAQAVTGAVRLNVGFEWDRWSRVGTLPVVSVAAGLPVSALPFDYRDGFMYSFGGEVDVDERLTLRAGVAYEVSPITARDRGVRLPDNDRVWASLGASYRWNEKLTLTAAYSHLFLDRAPIAIAPGNALFNAAAPLPFFGVADTSIDIVSLGARYRWDDPKVAVPAAVVARY